MMNYKIVWHDCGYTLIYAHCVKWWNQTKCMLAVYPLAHLSRCHCKTDLTHICEWGQVRSMLS